MVGQRAVHVRERKRPARPREPVQVALSAAVRREVVDVTDHALALLLRSGLESDLCANKPMEECVVFCTMSIVA